MGFLLKSFNIRLLLIICFLCLFISAAFFNFKASAQPQTASNANVNSAPSAAPSPAPASSPTPIPISLIIGEKEKTDRRLQEINKIFSEQLPVVRLQNDVAALTEGFDEREEEANNLIISNPSLEALGKTESYWSAMSLSLPSRKDRIQTQASEISAQLAELQNMQVVWELTGKSLEPDSSMPAVENNAVNAVNANTANVNITAPANKRSLASANRNANISGNLQVNTNVAANNNSAANMGTNTATNSLIQLPGNLKEQINELIGRIKQTQAIVQFKLGEVIKLQEKVSDTERRTNEMSGKIAAARTLLLSNLVVRDAPPIWSGESFSAGFGQRAESSLPEKFAALKTYFSEKRGLFLFHFLIILALVLVFRRARRKTRRLVEEEPKLKNGLIIFEHPLSSALVLGLFFGPALYWQAPDLLGLLASPFLVIAIFFLFRHLVERSYLPILMALVVLYLINDLRLLTAPIPILTRTIFLVEMLGGITFLVWLIRLRRLPPDPADFPHSETIRKIGMLLLALFVFAFLANAFGYVGLAGVVGKATVFSLSLGLILYALVKVADSLLIFVFRIPPFSKLGMVKNHRPLMQKKIFKIFKWSAIAVWAIFSLSQAYLLDPFLNALERILEFELGSKSISFSVGSIIALVLIVWFSFLLSRFIRFTLEQDVYPRVHLASGLPYAASTILHYLVLLAGAFLALSAAGIDLTKFTIFLGALGVGVGIGLQNIVENFTSGLILLLERPVKVGDSIQMNQHQGELRHIGLRASIVKTFDGAEVIVPNGQLITEQVTNWTLSDERRRLDIDVGVEYGADPEKIIDLLVEIGKNHPETDRELPPRALFLGFGENALNFQLRAWTANRSNWLFIKSDLTLSIYKALKASGIQIPFPQRDLHIKSIDENLLNNMNITTAKSPKENKSS